MKTLRDTIEDIVFQMEEQEDHKLTGDEVVFLINTYEELVRNGIRKFIQGSKEHEGEGDFLTDCPHKQEITSELIDFIHYHFADLIKQRKHDRRIG